MPSFFHSKLSVRFLHVITCCYKSFFLGGVWNSIVWIFYNVSATLDGHLGRFQFRTIMHKASVHIENKHVLWWNFFFLEYLSRSEFAGSQAMQIISFVGRCQFSKVDIPIYMNFHSSVLDTSYPCQHLVALVFFISWWVNRFFKKLKIF